jgi:hypothetical protein
MLGMLGDKKKVVSIILGEQLPKQKDVPKGLESDMLPAKKAIAQDLIKAIKGDDIEGVLKALEDHYYLCDKEEDYQEGESEDLMEG